MKKWKFKKQWLILPTIILSASALIFGTQHIVRTSISNASSQNTYLLNELDNQTTNSAATSMEIAPDYDQSQQVNVFIEQLRSASNLENFLKYDLDSSFGYLIISNLPLETKLTLQSNSIISNFDTGMVSFSIEVDAYKNAEGLTIEEPKSFSFQLQFAVFHEKTQMVVNPTYPNALSPDEFKAYVINNQNEIDPERLSKFVGINSIPADTILTAKIDVSDTTTGLISFTINASKAYDENGAIVADTYPISLDLAPANALPLATNLVKLESLPVDANAVTFFSEIISNNTVDYSALSYYIDLSTLPYDATLSIGENPSSNPNTGNVLFNVKTDLVYDGVAMTPLAQTASFDYDWILRAKIGETKIVSNGLIERALTADQFLARVAPNGKTDYEALSVYVDLSKIPSTATLQVENATEAPLTSNISFDVFVNKYYDTNSHLINGFRAYNVTLEASIELQENAMKIESWIFYVIGFGSLFIVLLIVFIIIKIRDKENKKYFEFEDYEKL